MAVASFGLEIRIHASPAAVWSVLATPSRQSEIEPRVRLVSEWGEPGVPGSGYELAMGRRPATRLTVTDAVPGEWHRTEIAWNGRPRGSQDARLRAEGASCLLAYTVSLDVPVAMRPIQRAYGRRQLSRWLDAVARVSAPPRP